jgi:rod shape-determining protein MreB
MGSRSPVAARCCSVSMLGLDRRLQQELKMPVHRADDPLTCVARGTGRVAEALHLYQRALASGQALRRG